MTAPSCRVLASVAPSLDSAPALTPSGPAESLTAPIEHLDFEAEVGCDWTLRSMRCGVRATHRSFNPCGHASLLCTFHAGVWQQRVASSTVASCGFCEWTGAASDVRVVPL